MWSAADAFYPSNIEIGGGRGRAETIRNAVLVLALYSLMSRLLIIRMLVSHGVYMLGAVCPAPEDHNMGDRNQPSCNLLAKIRRGREAGQIQSFYSEGLTATNPMLLQCATLTQWTMSEDQVP